MDASRSLLILAAALPVLLALLLLVLVGGTGDTTSGCATPVGTGVGGPTGITVAGLSESQLKMARNGVAIGKQRGEPVNVIVSELDAAITESGLRNLANPGVAGSEGFANDGDGANLDSVGPHQMRAGDYLNLMGGMAGLMDPVRQQNWFYDAADKIPDAAHTDPAVLDQAIERSGRPDAYQGSNLELARQLYAKFADIDPASMQTAPAGQQPQGCGSAGEGRLIPPSAGPFGQAVIDAAMPYVDREQYVWGGGDYNGPTDGGFDCSGLTLFAVYQASGGRIKLAHYTQSQQDDPRGLVVPFADRQPGDLVYFTEPGEHDSHHVGIYYGRDSSGRDLVLNAPDTGQTVKIEPLSDWNGERMDFRRFGTTIPSDSGVSPRV